MSRIRDSYVAEVGRLARSATATEPSFYPAIKALLAGLLTARGLAFDVRINTSERREGGGTDLPDVALYDGAGQFPVVCGEVKLPRAEIAEMVASTAGDDQVGRYLARSHVLILSNVRAFALVTVRPGWSGNGTVPPSHRRLEQVVELWPSREAFEAGAAVDPAAFDPLADLLEAALTRFATITEPETLARILAWQARQAKADLPARFGEAVRDLLDDFGRALGVAFEGQEGEEFFRSSLIQTAYYGLFAGWVLWRRAGAQGTFRWEDLSAYLKIPFLGQLFHEFRHPARIRELRLAHHLDLATEVLQRVDSEAFFRRFRAPSLEQDSGGEGAAASAAILYFYEPFLEAFDPELRKELGVWYTPGEIVSYQVRKVDQLLREELGCERGFADERVVVLDPCCGTGAYLLEVLRCLARQLNEEGEEALLGAKLRDAFTKRIIGFEILTAPFVISQLQLYLVLAELGVAPDETQRPAVFLTNALTGWHGEEQMKLNFPELQQEHDAARAVKKDAKIIVILGNPPYNRFAGVPLEEEADLVDPYKGIRRDANGRQVGTSELFTRWGVRKHLLDDLYVRFFRLAEARIGERAEFGVVSFISNSSYLNGRSHPIMRESLLGSFQRIWVDNLHGNRLASERTPQGESCETIFNVAGGGPGIKVGTAVVTLLKLRDRSGAQQIRTRDFWGRAAAKRGALLASLDMANWSAKERRTAAERPEGPRPYEDFTPQERGGWKLVSQTTAGGYEDWPALDEMFPAGYQGVNPNRGIEGSLIDVDPAALEARMRDYFSTRSFESFRRDHPVVCEPRARYEPEAVRDLLRRTSRFQPDRLVPYLLFPLDIRSIYYETEGKLLNERRPELWDNLAKNEFLLAVPQPRRVSEARPLLATTLFDLHLHDRGSVGFPAEVRSAPEATDLFTAGRERGATIEANLHPALWEALKAAWTLRGGRDGAAARKLARSLFRAVLAITHSPQFEADHKDALAQDWARVPLPKDATRLTELAALGEKIWKLLDPAADARRTITEVLGANARELAVPTRTDGGTVAESALVVSRSYYGAARGDWRERPPGEGETSRDVWGATTGDLFLNDEACFRNVPANVWSHELGGYPVLKKWLGYRHADRRGGRPLTLAEAEHFRSMVQRLAALLVLAPTLDAAYEAASAECFTAEDLGLR
ncbi:MAG: type ISP restriction/modification enzyme [Candidatus Eisenbacteria bacterium]